MLEKECLMIKFSFMKNVTVRILELICIKLALSKKVIDFNHLW